MKKIRLFCALLLIISGCDWFESDNEEFIETYKNILIIREKYKNDSAKSANAIQKIYEQYDYTAESFKEEYFDLAQNQPRKFYELLDTIRERAKMEIINSGVKKKKENK